MKINLFFTIFTFCASSILSAQGDDIPNLPDIAVCADSVESEGNSNTYSVVFDFDDFKSELEQDLEDNKYEVSFSSQSDGDGILFSGQMSIPSSTIFTLFSEVGTGVSYEVSFNINVLPIPNIDLTGDFSICEEGSSTRIDTNTSEDCVSQWQFIACSN